jgi:PilZ domain
MSDMESIRKFEYRRSRMKTGFGIDFVSDGETLHGICGDVSDAGIRAEFTGPLVVGRSGLLILRHPSGAVKIEAQVAYIEKHWAGLVFLFKTPSDCEKAIQFVASISSLTAV